MLRSQSNKKSEKNKKYIVNINRSEYYNEQSNPKYEGQQIWYRKVWLRDIER
jgi:hypothetical protein